MRTLPTLILLTIALTASAEGLAAQKKATGSQAPSTPAHSAMQSNGLTLSEAIDKVRRQYNGRIVDAKTVCNGNRETHVIKVLTKDGKVKTVSVPGKHCG